MPIRDRNGNNITAVNVIKGGVTTSITTVNVVKGGVTTTVFSTVASPPPPPPPPPPPSGGGGTTPPPTGGGGTTPPPPPTCPPAGTVLRTFTDPMTGAQCIAIADGNCGENITCEF